MSCYIPPLVLAMLSSDGIVHIMVDGCMLLNTFQVTRSESGSEDEDSLLGFLKSEFVTFQLQRSVSLIALCIFVTKNK